MWIITKSMIEHLKCNNKVCYTVNPQNCMNMIHSNLHSHLIYLKVLPNNYFVLIWFVASTEQKFNLIRIILFLPKNYYFNNIYYLFFDFLCFVIRIQFWNLEIESNGSKVKGIKLIFWKTLKMLQKINSIKKGWDGMGFFYFYLLRIKEWCSPPQ